VGSSSQPGPILAEVEATTTAAKGIARGDLSQRVPLTSNDEVGELAATFNYMAAELERAEQLRRNMTADVAHELCTPLSVVRGKLEGVLDGVYPATP
jgi:two-component system sensor histidine kinase BaeS